MEVVQDGPALTKAQAWQDFLAMFEGPFEEAEELFDHWWETAEVRPGGPVCFGEGEHRLISDR